VNNIGRMPGVAEEVILTLAMRKPVYIAGGFGGAAADVGRLLGFGHPRTGEIPFSLRLSLEKETKAFGNSREVATVALAGSSTNHKRGGSLP